MKVEIGLEPIEEEVSSMDIRQLNLLGEEYKTITGDSKSDYMLSEEKHQVFIEHLLHLKDLEFWDPEYQAWKPLLTQYLMSGCDPTLTLQYGSMLSEKQDFLEVTPSKFHNIFVEAVGTLNRAQRLYFEEYSYKDLEDFANNICTFYLNGYKRIRKQVYNADINISTIKALYNQNTYKGMMCALYLYRHCQIEEMTWPQEVTDILGKKISEWLDKFFKSFDELIVFTEEQRTAYDWYCPTVKDVLTRVWQTALSVGEGRIYVRPNDVYQVSAELSTRLMSYISKLPAAYDIPIDTTVAFDGMSNLFFNDASESPDFLNTAYFALCIPKTYFGRMCDVLSDFYWIIKDGKLTQALYDIKVAKYKGVDSNEQDPASYLTDLYYRGFPDLRKE